MVHRRWIRSARSVLFPYLFYLSLLPLQAIKRLEAEVKMLEEEVMELEEA